MNFHSLNFLLRNLCENRPPEGIELKPLSTQSDIEKVFSEWPVNKTNTKEFIARAVKYNPSIGAYTKDGTLVAWVLR